MVKVLLLVVLLVYLSTGLLGEVIRVGNSNFSSIVDEEADALTIVLYYAPWCSYSKQFLPVYDEVEAIFASSSEAPAIKFAKVDW
jgi:thiol-disulfide isomerase/thioredoxin